MQTAAETASPPTSLESSQAIARVVTAAGNNLFRVETPQKEQWLVELPARFRSEFWIKRGGYVLVDSAALAERDNKLGGEIVNVVRDEKAWRKMDYWPAVFKKSRQDDEDHEDSVVGQMPPSDDERGEDDSS